MSYSEGLRGESAEMRKASALVLDALSRDGSAARQNILRIAAIEDTNTLREELQRLAESLPDDKKTVRLVTAITGAVTANVYDALADMADYFRASGALRRVSDRLKEHSRIQHALRMAAAKGNWDEFFRIADELSGSTGGPGDGGGDNPPGTTEAPDGDVSNPIPEPGTGN